MVLMYAESPSLFNWVAWAGFLALVLWNIHRFGLLSFACLYFASNALACLPLTTDFSAWYASYGLVGVGLIAALAVFGFYTSRGNRPLFSAGPPART
jgi:hypothetical protein